MIHLAKDGKQLLCTSIVFLILDVFAVILRYVAKSRTKYRFALDDACIFLTLVVFAAWAGLVIGSREFHTHISDYKLMETGVVDVGGTYNYLALPYPLSQLSKIYKVSTLRPFRNGPSITSLGSFSILRNCSGYGVSPWLKSPSSHYTRPSSRLADSGLQKTVC